MISHNVAGQKLIHLDDSIILQVDELESLAENSKAPLTDLSSYNQGDKNVDKLTNVDLRYKNKSITIADSEESLPKHSTNKSKKNNKIKQNKTLSTKSGSKTTDRTKDTTKSQTNTIVAPVTKKSVEISQESPNKGKKRKAFNPMELSDDTSSKDNGISDITLPEPQQTKLRRSRRLLQRISRNNSNKQVDLPSKKQKLFLAKAYKVNVALKPTHIPSSYNAAINSVNKSRWETAISEELSSHHELGTWDSKPFVVDLKDKRIESTINTRWVFAVKGDGTYKARLVARGDLQAESTYDQTYSPTLRPEIARTILAQNASFKWYFAQYDFKTAYLNSKLDKDIYIYSPQGIPYHSCKKTERVIYKLKRGLYALKQAGRLCNIHISKSFEKLGYISHPAFPSTFIKRDKKSNIVSIIG
ncbi:hypothetical protein CANINC_002602, partial [Pichia inconspicua]